MYGFDVIPGENDDLCDLGEIQDLITKTKGNLAYIVMCRLRLKPRPAASQPYESPSRARP